MSREHIEFVDYAVRKFSVPMPEAFRFKPAGRLAWLQRVAWRFLQKFRALEKAFETREEVKRIRFDKGDFMRMLYQQRRSLARHFLLDGGVLLIGAEDFEGLVSSPEIRSVMTFNVAGDQHQEFMGMRVTVIPWMTGAVVLPKGVAL